MPGNPFLSGFPVFWFISHRRAGAKTQELEFQCWPILIRSPGNLLLHDWGGFLPSWFTLAELLSPRFLGGALEWDPGWEQLSAALA
jgi:hypothetical protein